MAWIRWGLTAALAVMAGCSAQSGDTAGVTGATSVTGADGATGTTGAATGTAAPIVPPAGSAASIASSGPKPGTNYPQEELKRKTDSIKIAGTITVPGYEKGTLQVDVYPPVEQLEGQSPFTTARFPKPGAWELLLPPGTGEVRLVAYLDFEGNGPDARDASAELPGTVDVQSKRTGIDFKIDKANTKMPPPQDPASGEKKANGDRPPWEIAEAEAAKSGDKKSDPKASEPKPTGTPKPAPQGKPVPAPPGAKGGPKEGPQPTPEPPDESP